MTCIVGIIDKDRVIIGGDSAGVAGLNVTIRKDTKVFKNGPFIMGFTSSFRMGQLLMSSKFKPPKQKLRQSDYDYMITDFIDCIRTLFKTSGYSKINNNEEEGGTFLVGYKGGLYDVQDDFQVGISVAEYNVCGCGVYYAKGSLYTSKNIADATDRVTKALETAAHFSGGVCPPFNYVSMRKSESAKLAKLLKPAKKPKKKKK